MRLAGLSLLIVIGRFFTTALDLRSKSQDDAAESLAAGELQGGVVPYRVQDEQVQLCLITLNSQSGWGFPKGGVDPPETLTDAALREAFEEAGIRGHIVGEALGGYSYVKRGAKLDVTVFLMCVTAVEPYWPERRQRQRQFCTVEQARSLLVVPGQRQILDLALARIGSGQGASTGATALGALTGRPPKGSR